MDKKIIVYLLILFSFESYSQAYLNQLAEKSEFDQLAGLPLTEKYGQVSSLKLVYSFKKDRVYFVNSKYYKYHHEFCSSKLEAGLELGNFNRINYSDNSKRKYLLANINYYKTIGIYALELSPVDQMTEEDILLLWDLVSKASYIGEELHLFLNSARLQNFSEEFEMKIPVLNPSKIYKNLDYQAVAKYKKCGVVHFINDLDVEIDEINPMDIIVINKTPLVLPNVSGIICTEFQTPLSHLSILGQNRKIPIMVHKNAYQDSSLIKLNSEKVCFQVFSDTFNMDIVDKLKVNKQSKRQIKLKYNLEVDHIVDIEEINNRSYKFAGNKASNFGILYKLSHEQEFKVPECAFVIPFYFYYQHVINSDAQSLIDSLIFGNKTLWNNDSVKLRLKVIRKEILAAPINNALLDTINKKVTNCDGFERFRFRSSTNAEDAKGFSGAGLYASKTGVLNDNKKTFEKAIKKVWASLWSLEAYFEREYYNINHQDVFMGILVHRSFPREEVNGVAITKNLYRPDNYGFVVNAQIGDESVVKPKQGNICDQFICYPDDIDNLYQGKNTIDIITLSNLNDDQLVMTETEIQLLANELELIKKYFMGHSFTSKPYLEYGLDIEFKLDEKGRKLYIKQVRIYND